MRNLPWEQIPKGIPPDHFKLAFEKPRHKGEPLYISFEIPQELKDQGIEAFQVKGENGILRIINGPIILFPFHMNKYDATIEKLRDKLLTYKIDEQLTNFYCIKITELILEYNFDHKTGKVIKKEQGLEAAQKETQLIIEGIDRLRKEYKEIPYEIWEQERKKRYDKLRCTVAEKIPQAWESIEIVLTVKGIRHIKDITLPLILIMIGDPSTWKTLGISLMRRWPDTWYEDKINPKSWVSHAAKNDEKELDGIDLIRAIKDKMFLVSELAPIFMQKEEVVIDTLSTLIRLADGEGLLSHSALWGTRGLDTKVMFTMLGAIVHIASKIYKVLSALGPKIYFYSPEFQEATEDELVAEITGERFESKRQAIKDALFVYLTWIEVCPSLIEIKEFGDKEEEDSLGNSDNNEGSNQASHPMAKRVIEWNKEKDDPETIRTIAKLAIFLARVRGNVYAYQARVMTNLNDSETGESTDGGSRSEYEYVYNKPIIERPGRATTVLYNIARAHAFELHGRTNITEEDLPVIIKIVLSAANRDRIAVVKLLLNARSTDGVLYKELDTTYLVTTTKSSKSSVQRTMKELNTLGLVDIGKTRDSSHENYICLRKEFQWLHEERFQLLLKICFQPLANEDNSNSENELIS
jgi:hypothetical protein